MSSSHPLTLTVDGAVAVLLLDRPASLNALNRELRRELRTALEQAGADDRIRAVVIGGNGPTFCAGADLWEAGGDGGVAAELLGEYWPCFAAIAAMDKPVIAAVGGTAAGIGMSLALHCDLLVMAEDAVLWPAFGGIGLVPDGGASYLLVRQLGARLAFQILAEAERIGAARALQLGLANQVVPGATLLDAARERARRLASLSPVAVAGTRKLVRLAMEEDFATVFRSEAQWQARCTGSEYFQERLREFQRKRAGNRGSARSPEDGEAR